MIQVISTVPGEEIVLFTLAQVSVGKPPKKRQGNEPRRDS
jgi:hypothetical protein